jgi:autotransporter adhesin
LKGIGVTTDSTGGVTNSFVSYTDTTNNKVSLGGSAGTVLSNVADGKAAKDAVNVGQLAAAGIVFNSSGVPSNSFVAYDTVANDLISLKGATGTRITNVAAGALTTASKDAVNGSQLLAVAQSAADAVGGSSSVGWVMAQLRSR